MKWLFALAALPLLGCFASPAATAPTNNPEIQVDLLFAHDGCRVYRFRDGGYHYYARCDGVPHVAVETPLKQGHTDSVPTFDTTAR